MKKLYLKPDVEYMTIETGDIMDVSIDVGVGDGSISGNVEKDEGDI